MMRTAALNFVSRLHLLNNDKCSTATANSNQVFSYLKMLRTAARTEKKWGARRVGVRKVRRASRCGALIYTRRAEPSSHAGPKHLYASVKITAGYVWYH